MDTKTHTEELSMNKTLPELKLTMPTQQEHMNKESINSQTSPKKNSLLLIWHYSSQKDGKLVNSQLKQTNQMTQSIGVHQFTLRTKEAVVHAGPSQQLVLLKLTKRLLRESLSVSQNNN